MKSTTKLATKLEHDLLAAVVNGACSPSIVDPKELSKVGRIIHNAITQLIKNGLEVPLQLSTIYTHAISNLGAPAEDTESYLRVIHEISEGKDSQVLSKIAKEKEALVGLLNEASKQLSSGTVEFTKFEAIIEQRRHTGDSPKPIAETHKDYKGEPEQGVMLDSLPTISDATRGVQGVWVLGGREGVGKSTLGLQIAIEVQLAKPVLYYDIDGTGENWICYRVTQAVGSDNFQQATQNLYYRPDINNLDSDLLAFPPPAMLVIDSLQTLPYDNKHRRSSVDGWLNYFKRLINKGYTVLIVSEMSREGDYKESSGINYAGTVNAELQVTDGDMLEFHIKKNRHGKQSGHVATLVRGAQYPFWLEEV